jgi:polysaccharide export outer membrane protein
VLVQEVNSKKFNILGEVVKPGPYSVAVAPTVVDAIAAAGGFRDFAKKSGVYILRTGADGRQVRLNFNYKEFVKGKNPEQNIKLEANDTVIVP